MSVRALVTAPVVFLLAVTAQVLLWRCRRTAGQYAALLGLHLATVGAATAVFIAARWLAPPATRLLPLTVFEYANFVVLYVALLVAYATTFSAIQADSPTMSLLLRIEQAGTRGMTREELIAELTDELLVIPRLDDLVAGGLARLDGGHYVIEPRGALFAWAMASYRRLLGMERGG